MSSGTLTYRLPTLTGLTKHSDQTVSLVRDGEYRVRHVTIADRLKTEIRSGDYFVTLATVLDALSGRLESYDERVELEGIISDLIYLQDNYKIIEDDQPDQWK